MGKNKIVKASGKRMKINQINFGLGKNRLSRVKTDGCSQAEVRTTNFPARQFWSPFMHGFR